MLVVGLQEAVPAPVERRRRREGVGAEEHALAVLGDQAGGRARLAAELGHAPGDVDDHVRVAREHAVDPVQVLGMAADVRDDEGRARVRGDQRLERLHEAREAREVTADRTTTPASRAAPRGARCVPSTGSKNATGSAVWISTGSPSSPAAANTGASRSSSGSTSAPLASRIPSPRSFQILRPRAPASRERRRLSASASGVEARARPMARRSTWQNVTKRPGMRAVVAVEVALQLVAPEAVQVDDRLDSDLVEQRDQRADVGDRPGPLGAAHELGRVERQPVVPERRASARGGCARRPPAPSGSGTSVLGSTSRDCGSQSSSAGLIA